AVTVANASGVTGTVSAAIDASANLKATASGPVSIAAGGSFDLVFTATPSVLGTFTSPRSGGTPPAHPNNVVAQNNESNNTCTGAAAVAAPDLTATLTDNVGGATPPGQGWTWKIVLSNGGNAPATFGSGQELLLDNLPNSNISYGAVSVSSAGGVTGT